MCKDKLFLLSDSEVHKYLPEEETIRCKYKGEYEWWWLRSPGRNIYYTAVVNINGYLHSDGFYVNFSNYAVRPAMYIRPMYLATLKRTKKGYVQFGGIKWMVLDEESGLLLSKKAVDIRPFDKGGNNYETSDIRKYLNGVLLNELFTDAQQQMIMNTVIDGEESYRAAA